MIQKILTLFLSVSLLTSCGSDNDSFTNEGGSNNGNNNSSTIIATPGMAKPVNPIPESAWAGNWNDKNNPNYPGEDNDYNPIQGDWILTAINGKSTDQFLVYRFSYGRGCYKLSSKPAEGVSPSYGGASTVILYDINDKQLKVENGYIYNYSVASDRSWMTLYDGTNTYTFGVYDNNGVWYWKGDWNSKSSPYYSIYQGKYNPVEGTWREVVTYNTEPMYYIFTDDFRVGHSPIYDGYWARFRNYEINDDGIQEEKYGITASGLNRYKIEGDTMYLNPYIYSGGKYVPYDNSTTKLVRVQ